MDMKSRSTEHGPEPTTSTFLTCGCNGHTIYALYLDPPDGWQNNLPQGFGHFLVSMRIVQGGVWADTDGVIIPLDKAYSLEKAGWKRKEAMSVFQIEDWAHTRYHCIKQTPRGITDVCSICSPLRWHYRIDGVTPDSDDASVAWGLYTPGEYWETDSQGVTLASDDAERFKNSLPSVLPYDKIPIQRGI